MVREGTLATQAELKVGVFDEEDPFGNYRDREAIAVALSQQVGKLDLAGSAALAWL